MSNSRDGFTQATIQKLSTNVNNICSNPECRIITKSAKTDAFDKTTIIGVAAHIHAAAKGGPRYKGEMSSEERKAEGNGIWLCQNCARLIDVEPEKYTAELLYEWKKQACEFARNSLGKKLPKLSDNYSNQEPSISIELDYIDLTNGYVVYNKIDRAVVHSFLHEYYETKSNKINCVVPLFEKQLKEFKENNNLDIIQRNYAINWYEDAIDKTQNKVSFILNMILSKEFINFFEIFINKIPSLKNIIDITTETLNYSLIPEYRGFPALGKKFDIWRTIKPKLSTAIYLDKCDIEVLLKNVDLNNVKDLAFGAGWRNLGDINDYNIKLKALSSILFSVYFDSVNKENYKSIQLMDLLPIHDWHIGLG